MRNLTTANQALELYFDPVLPLSVLASCDSWPVSLDCTFWWFKGRRIALARALVAWLAVRFRPCTLAEVAEHFSRSPSTLSHLVANLEKLSHNSGEPADALRKHLYAHCRPDPIYPPELRNL
jgi:hypothetical protein